MDSAIDTILSPFLPLILGSFLVLPYLVPLDFLEEGFDVGLGVGVGVGVGGALVVV